MKKRVKRLKYDNAYNRIMAINAFGRGRSTQLHNYMKYRRTRRFMKDMLICAQPRP